MLPLVLFFPAGIDMNIFSGKNHFKTIKLNPFNYIFYTVLFVGFFLPTNSSFFISFPGVQLEMRELAFLLMPLINIFCSSENQIRINDAKLKKLILLFILLVAFTELLLKMLAFDQSFADAFKSFRIAIPLLSSLVILYCGVRADSKLVWRVLLLAIGCSVVISFISLFYELPIYNVNEGTDAAIMSQGRLGNANSSFGIVALYLSFKDKDKWFNKGRLVKSVNLLSLMALILSFNRTYLALLFLAFIYISFATFSGRNAFKILFIPITAIGVFIAAYNTSPVIQMQVDQRIFSILLGQTTLKQSTIDDNRDIIYTGILDKVERGYWIIGLPYHIPIFLAPSYNNQRSETKMSVTDTSFANILLRYGFMPLLLLALIFKRLYYLDAAGFYKFAFVAFLIASFNIDSLVRHNTVFFLMLILLISNFQTSEKDTLMVNTDFNPPAILRETEVSNTILSQ